MGFVWVANHAIEVSNARLAAAAARREALLLMKPGTPDMLNANIDCSF